MNKNLDIANLLEYNKNKKINLDTLFSGMCSTSTIIDLPFQVDLYQYSMLLIYLQGYNPTSKDFRIGSYAIMSKVHNVRLSFFTSTSFYFNAYCYLVDNYTLRLDAQTKAGFTAVGIMQVHGIR